ncbi:RNA polymerase sigma-70 factor (ECF subfamily) [Allocatelliglobosispora scoriae]|uniref:RNA polymerase sigma factor n=1 Tax=Allocatelliglobosispora scoriae TaxID=643052 RepID=A0A841C2S9_9ACTN|nr:sigma-70 family RNA polymerase sigma factor [Allocatelliglobosispora scoriae]MBB5874206.1 RNA polymerase sigma-70 factor (ECF subfamily) [Allocatelliglobosispora scoriae]
MIANDCRPARAATLEELYRTNAGSLYAYSLKLTLGDVSRAEDLVQETMMRAWEHIDELDVTRSAARPWLFTVARRLMIDNLRARAARPVEVGGEHLDGWSAVHDDTEAALTRMTVRSVMAELPGHHRDVLAHLYLAERTTEETAQALGIPAGTVKSRAHHALRRARRAL